MQQLGGLDGAAGKGKGAVADLASLKRAMGLASRDWPLIAVATACLLINQVGLDIDRPTDRPTD